MDRRESRVSLTRAKLLIGVSLSAVAVRAQEPPPRVDLSGAEHRSLDEAKQQQENAPTAQREWFRRFDVYGYIAAGYFRTTTGGSVPKGAMLLDQATLFIDATVHDDVSAFVEIRTDRAFADQTNTVRAGRVFVHWRHVDDFGGDGDLGFTVGRIALPFGQYYAQQDANNNPLISQPVGALYGLDEGVMAYGTWRGIGFAASYTDGNATPAGPTGDGQPGNQMANCVTLRLEGDALPDLHATGSYLHCGPTSESAMYIGGPGLTPIGAEGTSTLGNSPSPTVSSDLFEIDLKWEPKAGSWLRAVAGHGDVHDDAPGFSRGFDWFLLEPSFAASERLRFTLCWSAIGTFDGSKGFRFEGTPFGNGTATFGYDTERMQRMSGCAVLGLKHHFDAKLEVGADRLQAIGASPFGSDTRWFTACELVLTF